MTLDLTEGKMVDRVAKAICCPNGCEAHHSKYDPIGGSVAICQAPSFREAAIAAIEAMREPTPEMYSAAYAANGGKWSDNEFEPPPKTCWEAMIDAALK